MRPTAHTTTCRVIFAGAAALLFAFLPSRASAQSSCDSLAGLKLKNATITAATLVPEGPAPGRGAARGGSPVTVPAHCSVTGVATPSSDSSIGFEVWLPASGWNGKFEQVGNGGLAGAIPQNSMIRPLLSGYAIAATDDGHKATNTDATWAAGHPEKVIDFGYRAVHETSVQAKAVVNAFYGKDPTESYFVGCSDGGREALMEAQRYPDDFIGIIAGAPANFWTHLLDTAIWLEQALRSDPASAIPAAKLPVIQKAAVEACDKLDGVKDGIISDPEACKFDPATIQCKADDAPDCLTAAQVVALKKIYSGPKNSTGQIYPGFPAGTEAVPNNWPLWITGGTNGQEALAWQFGNTYFRNIIFNDPKWDFRSFNFERDPKLNDEEMAAILNSNNPDLSAFKKRGGKLIQFHGWGDAAISPFNSINYFEAVQARMAPKGSTADFYRLFMVPGMIHCAGGIGATSFGNAGLAPGDAQHDIVVALEQWVEKNVAPEKIVATGTVPDDPAHTPMTRPLCSYPQQAQYKGSGDPNEAANFICAAPKKRS